MPSPKITHLSTPLRLGLRANWQQFVFLVVINACVGGMVGIERTILPLLAEQDFDLASKTPSSRFSSALAS